LMAHNDFNPLRFYDRDRVGSVKSSLNVVLRGNRLAPDLPVKVNGVFARIRGAPPLARYM